MDILLWLDRNRPLLVCWVRWVVWLMLLWVGGLVNLELCLEDRCTDCERILRRGLCLDSLQRMNRLFDGTHLEAFAKMGC